MGELVPAPVLTFWAAVGVVIHRLIYRSNRA